MSKNPEHGATLLEVVLALLLLSIVFGAGVKSVRELYRHLNSWELYQELLHIRAAVRAELPAFLAAGVREQTLSRGGFRWRFRCRLRGARAYQAVYHCVLRYEGDVLDPRVQETRLREELSLITRMR